MIPQEKAKELFFKMSFETHPYNAKHCALVAVDEIIDAIFWHEFEVPNKEVKFWFEVKKEIEKL